MRGHINDADGYGRTIAELRQSVVQRDLQRIELERKSRRGLVPTERGRRRKPEAADLHAAFARASREQRELQRLKATGKQSACLDYHP